MSETLYKAEPQPKHFPEFNAYRLARVEWRMQQIEKGRTDLAKEFVWQAFHRVTLKRWLAATFPKSNEEKKLKKTIPAVQTFVNEKREELQGKTSREIGKMYGQWLASLNLKH